MKKNTLLVLLAMGSSAALMMTGCSKDDTTAPSITITGSTSEEISLQSGPWSDPGATATDEEDGAVTVTSDASATNPNPNHTGTYTITYTATDAAGNMGTAIRTVRVKNDAEVYAKTYQVTDIIPSGTLPLYPQTITVDETINNKVHFDRFGDYTNNTDIYAIRDSATGNLSIPLQSSGHQIGTNNGGQCDVVKHYFYSTSFAKLSSSILFNYVDSLADASPCSGTSTAGTAEYSY